MQEQKLLKRKRKAACEGNKSTVASTCIDLAELYSSQERYDDAVEEYIAVANVYKQMGKQLDFARANRMIGEVYTHLREYDKALKYQQIHLNIAREQNDKLEEQRALATIGHTHLTSYLDIIDNPDKTHLNSAYRSFMKSLVVCESLTHINKHEHKDMTARLLANLGVVEECQGNYDKGVELVQRSINICKSHDLFEQLERGYTFLGSLYVRKGEYHKAISQYNLAAEAAGRLKNKIPLMCASLSAKADILIKLADFHGAKNVLLRAHKLKNPCAAEKETVEHNLKVVAAMCYTEDALLTTSTSDHKTRKRLYEKLGDGACSLKNYSIAIEYYQKMLEAAKSNGEAGKDLSPCYISLAETYRDDKEFDLAIRYFKKEYNVTPSNTKDSIGTLLNIADCMEAAGKNVMEIENFYNKARNECIMAGDRHLEHKVLSRYIAMLRKNNRFSQAAQLDSELRQMDSVLSESENEPSEEQMTPNIGDDISINDITDVSDASDTENDASKPRTTRKRSRGMIIKRNNKGETQLHTACISGNVILVKRLLDQGHVVNVRDNCGWLPIHEACICGHAEIVEMLIEKGAAINDRGGTLCNGMTPLHDAASNGHLHIIQLLLDKGASAIAKNDIGEMPLHILKKWRATNQLDAVSESLYVNLVERLTDDAEKLGHGKDIVVPEEQNPALVLEEEEEDKLGTQRRSRRRTIDEEGTVTSSKFKQTTTASSCQSPRGSPQKCKSPRGSLQKHKSPQKNKQAIGSLRRNVSFDEDLDISPSKIERHCLASEDSESDGTNYAISETRKNIDAKEEYKWVMENLRHPLREEPFEKKRKSNETQRRSAYLEPGEVGDDWLEDDLACAQHKKRKTGLSDAFINSLGTRRSASSLERHSSASSVKSRNSLNNELDIPDEFFDTNFTNLLPEEKKESLSDIVVTDSDDEIRTPSYSALKKKKHQSSLIDKGFTRSHSFSSTEVIANSGSVVSKRKHQAKLTNFGHTRNSVEKQSENASNLICSSLKSNYSASIFSAEPTLSIDVRIDSKLYRVPVLASEMHTRTIKWLAEEAAKRYSRKECMKPTLELETKNGAVLADEDFLSILFSAGRTQAEEVEARILKWNLPPLCDRYSEACTNTNIAPNENLVKLLQEASTSLDLSDLTLLNKNAAPLCKALNRQINLHHLNLSGNFIFDESVFLLCSSLPSLDNLAVLNLSLNQLTSDSLRYLADMFTESSKSLLGNLVSLDLSYNPLGDECLKYLAVITRYLKLHTLNLISVDFSSKIFETVSNRNVDLSLDYVANLDISYNRLGKQQIVTFLSWLKPQNVETLDISSNINHEEGLTKEVVTWLQSRGEARLTLKELYLSRCHATDAEIYELLRVLVFANNIKTLNFSYNESLTSLSLRRLLQHEPPLSALDLTGCENIFKYFEDCTENTWNCMKLKQCKISFNCEIYAREQRIFVNMWKNEHREKSQIIEDLQGFIELSVSNQVQC